MKAHGGIGANGASVAAIVRWYFHEGRVGGMPFYCDPTRIGAFAIEPDELRAGTDAAIFRLFVTFSMYQALRDVVIMRQQRSLPSGARPARAPSRRECGGDGPRFGAVFRSQPPAHLTTRATTSPFRLPLWPAPTHSRSPYGEQREQEGVISYAAWRW